MSKKLVFKQLDPYQIYNTVEKKETYMLKELIRLHLASVFTIDRPKKFYTCQQLGLDCIFNFNQEVIPTIKNFLAKDSLDKIFLSQFIFIFQFYNHSKIKIKIRIQLYFIDLWYNFDWYYIFQYYETISLQKKTNVIR